MSKARWYCKKHQCEFGSGDCCFMCAGALYKILAAELAATDSQQIKPKMPSLQEFLNFALNDVDGYKTNEEVYNYFARHFGR